MGQFSRVFEPFYEETSEDLYAFCRALNFTPTWQQKMLLDAVDRACRGVGSRQIACKSGQGPGKTTVSAVVGLWRTWRRVGALTVITAPTMRQCRDVWLVEARRRLKNAHPILQKYINITKSKIEINGDADWGVKLVTATREENAQGYHQDNMTVIAEEASGIPREIITQFKGTISNSDSLFIQIGNPNTRDCAFFDCFNSQRDEWECMTFNAEQSPPEVVNQESRRKLKEEFGEDSDVYRVRVLGEFPHMDPNCVISSEHCEWCYDPKLFYKHILTFRPAEFGGDKAKQFGIDLARFGGDESVIYRRSGNTIVEWKTFSHTEPAHVIDYAFRMQSECKWIDKECLYVVDAGGMGQGVLSKFYDAGKRVFEFHNGGRAFDNQYDNRITEGWFQLGKKLKTRGCSIPKDGQLIRQLSARQYHTTKKGKLILESKDDYLKRNEHSPDRADALVYAFYDVANNNGNWATADNSKTVASSVMGVD